MGQHCPYCGADDEDEDTILEHSPFYNE